MQPSYLPLLIIFGSETRCTVPLFQRPYVWTETDNWAPLWDDISDLADRILATKDAKPVRGHFLGTVVLEQYHTRPAALPCARLWTASND
jgi:uncharacterized protein with ParB-like and HNH nuclease domain